MIRLKIKTCSLARDNELFTVFLQADSDLSAAVEGTFIIKAQDARTAGRFFDGRGQPQKQLQLETSAPLIKS
jgi:hypothetical protein